MSVKVGLVRSKDGTFTIDLGSKALPAISFNPMELEPEVRKEEHMGARLLLAAALTCYVNTMSGDLDRMGVENMPEIRSTARIEKEKGSNLRTRYTHIEINVEAGVDGKDREIFETVRNSLLNGSLVTYSLEEEIDLDYNIEAV